MRQVFRNHILVILLAITGCTESGITTDSSNNDSSNDTILENSNPIGSNVGVTSSEPVSNDIDTNDEGDGS